MPTPPKANKVANKSAAPTTASKTGNTVAKEAEPEEATSNNTEDAVHLARRVHAVLTFTCKDCMEGQEFVVNLGNNTSALPEDLDDLTEILRRIHDRNCDPV